METARMANNGYVQIPLEIRKKLNLKGDNDIAFVEKDGEFVIKSKTMLALEELCDGFKGVAEKLNLKTDQDVVNLIKQVRREVDEEKDNENNG